MLCSNLAQQERITALFQLRFLVEKQSVQTRIKSNTEKVRRPFLVGVYFFICVISFKYLDFGIRELQLNAKSARIQLAALPTLANLTYKVKL